MTTTTTADRRAYPVLTGMLLHIASTAKRQGLNRQIDIWWATGALDPVGIHLLVPVLLHNDTEMRCRVLLKTRRSDTPVEGWIDVPTRKRGSDVTWDEVQDHATKVQAAFDAARAIMDTAEATR